MDKKKVKELIQKAKHLAILRKYENRQTYLNNCICCLEEALKELQKSDWVKIANMNNIEQIDPICRLYYNKPVFITYGPIFTSSPKEYGQYLQNKKRKRK